MEDYKCDDQRDLATIKYARPSPRSINRGTPVDLHRFTWLIYMTLCAARKVIIQLHYIISPARFQDGRQRGEALQLHKRCGNFNTVEFYFNHKSGNELDESSWNQRRETSARVDKLNVHTQSMHVIIFLTAATFIG